MYWPALTGTNLPGGSRGTGRGGAQLCIPVQHLSCALVKLDYWEDSFQESSWSHNLHKCGKQHNLGGTGKRANEFGTLHAHMHKMLSITLELFSTCFSRQMRLSARREPNGEVCLIDVGGLDACEVHLLLPSPGCVWMHVLLSVCACVNLCMQVFVHQSVGSVQASKPRSLCVCVCVYVAVREPEWDVFVCGSHTFLHFATVCWLSRESWIGHCFSCSSSVLIALLWILIGCQKACNSCLSDCKLAGTKVV